MCDAIEREDCYFVFEPSAFEISFTTSENAASNRNAHRNVCLFDLSDNFEDKCRMYPR